MRIAYDTIPKPATAQEYLDLALSRARKEAARTKGIPDRTALVKAREKDRVRAIESSLVSSLRAVHDAYPSFERMGEFSRSLLELDIEIGKAKQALGGIQHAITTIRGLAGEHMKGISYARDEARILRTRNAFIGRIGSLLKQLDRHLATLGLVRTAMRALPAIDESLFTVAIAGFPNVGKSTLLRRITTAKPDVQPYAFTTKGLNVGYFEHRYNQIQCIDTPGTLNRERQNAIERKADIANRYLASIIVYVFDPTQASYPLEDQLELYARLEELEKPMLVYVSKTDVARPEEAKAVLGKFPGAFTDPDAMKKELVRRFREWV